MVRQPRYTKVKHVESKIKARHQHTSTTALTWSMRCLASSLPREVCRSTALCPPASRTCSMCVSSHQGKKQPLSLLNRVGVEGGLQDCRA